MLCLQTWWLNMAPARGAVCILLQVAILVLWSFHDFTNSSPHLELYSLLHCIVIKTSLIAMQVRHGRGNTSWPSKSSAFVDWTIQAPNMMMIAVSLSWGWGLLHWKVFHLNSEEHVLCIEVKQLPFCVLLSDDRVMLIKSTRSWHGSQELCVPVFWSST